MLNEDVKQYLIDRAKLSHGIIFAGPPVQVNQQHLMHGLSIFLRQERHL